MTIPAHSDTAYHVTQALHITKAIPAPLPGMTRGVSEIMAGQAPAMVQTLIHDNVEYVIFTVFDPTAPHPSTVLVQESWHHNRLSETVARVAALVEFFRHYNYY